MGACVGAGLAHLAYQLRQQHDGARREIAVGMTLHAPTLCDEQRFRLADFLGKLFDANLGDAGYPGGPGRSLLDHVVALAHDVGVIRRVLRRALRQRVFGVAHAVLLQELAVGKAQLLEFVCDTGHERRVGAGADGNPLGAFVGGDLVAARVDHDDAHILLLHGDVQVVTGTVTAHTHIHDRVSEQHYELIIL